MDSLIKFPYPLDLDISNNRLTCLSLQMKDLENLKVLNIRANPYLNGNQLVKDLKTIPNLKKLYINLNTLTNEQIYQICQDNKKLILNYEQIETEPIHQYKGEAKGAKNTETIIAIKDTDRQNPVNNKISFFDENLELNLKYNEGSFKGEPFHKYETEMLQNSEKTFVHCVKDGLEFIDLDFENPTQKLELYIQPICLCFLGNNNKLAIGTQGGRIFIYDLTKMSIVSVLGIGGGDIYCMKFIPETGDIWVGGTRGLRIWRNTKEKFEKIAPLINTICVVERVVNRIFVGGWDKILYELNIKGEIVGQIDTHDGAYITQLCFSGTDLAVIGTCAGGQISVLNINSRTLVGKFQSTSKSSNPLKKSKYLRSFSLLQITDTIFMTGGDQEFIYLFDIHLLETIKGVKTQGTIMGIVKLFIPIPIPII